MNTVKHSSRILGIAFLLQFITSFTSGIFLQSALFVPGNISATMTNIAENPELMMTTILADMLTAMGIVFLGVMLFITLRKQNEIMAGVGLGLYILEATLLATSQLAAFALLRISEAYVVTAEPANLLTLGNLAFEARDFVGGLLHILVFCLGAILFYVLLYQSRVIPRVLSLWGLITVLPLLFGVTAAMFGYEVSEFIYFPYVPFEFVVGLLILVKGINVPQEGSLLTEPA